MSALEIERLIHRKWTEADAESLFDLEGNNYQINFHNWSECVNGNVMLIILLSLLLLTAVFTGIGIFRILKRR